MTIVFVDRDGTLAVDQVRAVDAGRLQLTTGAREAVAAWRAAGWRIVLFTNNAGIARGLYSTEEMLGYHEALEAALGTRFDAVLYCPHLPDAGCACRKPKPGLLVEFAPADELRRAFVVGDSWRDVEAGRAVGARTALVRTEPDERESEPDLRAKDIYDAARWTLQA
jgi:D-glycero-D-manno-heptose 1,7-bisphosphate phosphatase